MPEVEPVARKAGATATHVARAKACVAVLRTADPDSVEMYEAFRELDSLPVDVVRAELAEWIGPLPDLEQLDAPTRLRLGLPLRPLRLVAVSITRDADIFDLGTLAEDQVRLACRSWDGADLPAEERLDGELDGSFAGTLQRLVLADADADSARAAPLFDVVLFAEDAGAVFASGTTTQLALIAYGKVEMRDGRTRAAIEAALAPTAAQPAATTTPDDEAPISHVAAAEAPKKTARKTATRTAAKTAAPAPRAPRATAASKPEKPAAAARVRRAPKT